MVGERARHYANSSGFCFRVKGFTIGKEMMFSVSYDAEKLCKTLVDMLQSSSDLHLVARSVILRGWHVTFLVRILGFSSNEGANVDSRRYFCFYWRPTKIPHAKPSSFWMKSRHRHPKAQQAEHPHANNGGF